MLMLGAWEKMSSSLQRSNRRQSSSLSVFSPTDMSSFPFVRLKERHDQKSLQAIRQNAVRVFVFEKKIFQSFIGIFSTGAKAGGNIGFVLLYNALASQRRLEINLVS